MYISIVGVNRVPLPYYREKLAVERLIVNAGLPWTILRATQFHDLLAWVFGVLSRSRCCRCWPGRAPARRRARRANRLVELAAGAPVGWAPDIGGPQVRPMVDLARAWLVASGRRRPVLPVRLPGTVARGYREGGHLAPEHRDGRGTFEEYLAGAPAGGRS